MLNKTKKKNQSHKSCTSTAAINQAIPNASAATTTIKLQQDQNNLQPIGQAKPPTDRHTTSCQCTSKTAQEHHSTTNDNPKHINPQSQQPETNNQQDHNKLDPLGPLTEPERQHNQQQKVCYEQQQKYELRRDRLANHLQQSGEWPGGWPAVFRRDLPGLLRADSPIPVLGKARGSKPLLRVI